jgi:hypothetical protein
MSGNVEKLARSGMNARGYELIFQLQIGLRKSILDENGDCGFSFFPLSINLVKKSDNQVFPGFDVTHLLHPFLFKRRGTTKRAMSYPLSSIERGLRGESRFCKEMIQFSVFSQVF